MYLLLICIMVSTNVPTVCFVSLRQKILWVTYSTFQNEQIRKIKRILKSEAMLCPQVH